MTLLFEELDARDTPLGVLSLRKRAELRLDNRIVYEVKLGDDFLMSSLFPEAEIQLSKLGLEALKHNGHTTDLQVIVGGLGLGYTAATALEDQSVSSLTVIDIMPAVIEWHQKHMVPLGKTLCSDPRCELQLGDFFELATQANASFGPKDKKVHAVFLDIDHSPSWWLDQGNSHFYSPDALALMRNKMIRGGVFGLWSDELPSEEFVSLLEELFQRVETHVISFPNPYTGKESTNAVYLAVV